MFSEKISNEYKRILVTGGCGFIGSNLTKRLLEITNSSIFNIDNLSYSSNIFFNKTIKNEFKNYNHLKIDLNNFEDLNKTITEINPDLILHLAAETHVDRSIDSPNKFIQTNILGTFNLLEASRKIWSSMSSRKKRIFKIIHISTDEVFGSLNEKGYFNERTQINPTSPYSASKASSDHLVNAWFHSFGLPTIITNCSNNYGPYQFPEKLIPLTIMKCLTNKKIPLYGDGSNIRDWIYVEDHVDALINLIVKGKIGERYCIGGEEEKTNKEVVKKICDIMDRIMPKSNSYKELIHYVIDRPGHDFRYAIDASKLKEEIRWKKKYTFEEGIEKTINWYLNNTEWCNKLIQNSNYNFERLGIYK